jgi:tetratricopeptide (TPR) repeat protein
MPRKRKTLSQPPIGLELLQSIFVVNNTTKVFHTPAVDKIMDEAMPLLHAGKGAQAEVLFRRALTLEPVTPDLLNNLAQALELQGLVDDGLCISETILILFPDYLFARATVATASMRDGDYEDALELLTPLFARREFHISEYNVLCSVLIEYSLLTGNHPAARAWFDAWSGPDPKNPKLDVFRELLKKINA